jgi:hypothetical protein
MKYMAISVAVEAIVPRDLAVNGITVYKATESANARIAFGRHKLIPETIHADEA